MSENGKIERKDRNVRHRRVKKEICCTDMVELDSDESVGGPTITDAMKESETKSDEETESEREHVRRLIASPLVGQCINKDRNKSVVRNDRSL